ncbi:MAG: 30S ribosomal protein S17 [Patescibacteria group bacterium]|nr:30S ribosomal protein S17 [Patescibacteria group bacterium]
MISKKTPSKKLVNDLETKPVKAGKTNPVSKSKKVLAKKKTKAKLEYKRPKLKFERINTDPSEKKVEIKKKIQGVVVSDKMDKTVVVSVVGIKVHSKYHKRYKRNKRYKVHDPENKYKIGDEVVFSPSKPYSKGKKWEVVESS